MKGGGALSRNEIGLPVARMWVSGGVGCHVVGYPRKQGAAAGASEINDDASPPFAGFILTRAAEGSFVSACDYCLINEIEGHPTHAYSRHGISELAPCVSPRLGSPCR